MICAAGTATTQDRLRPVIGRSPYLPDRQSRSVTITGAAVARDPPYLYVLLVIGGAAMPDAKWTDLRVAAAGDLRAVHLSCYRGQGSRWGKMRWWLRIPRCG